MKNKKNDNQKENNENDGFDYNDLLKDISGENESSDEDTIQSGENLDSIALSELLGDEDDKKGSKYGGGHRIQDEEDVDILSDIFDKLDDDARKSVKEESLYSEEFDQPEGQKEEESPYEHLLDKTGEILYEDLETESGDYASIVSKLEGSGDSEKVEEPESNISGTPLSDSIDSDFLGEAAVDSITAGFDAVKDDSGVERFSSEDDESKDETIELSVLSELDISEKSQKPAPDQAAKKEPEISDEDLELSEEQNIEETSSEPEFFETRFIPDESLEKETGDYASILNELEESRASEAADETESYINEMSMAANDDFDITDDDSPEDIFQGFDAKDQESDKESFLIGEEEAKTEKEEQTLLPDSDFMDEDMELTSDISEVEEVETGVSDKMKSEEAGDDFLGLGKISGVAGASAASLEGRWGGTFEVLFDGVEMDFDDQIAKVTLAELFLAQGKKQEAKKLFSEVSSRKGTTYWVAKRLDLFRTPGTDKAAEA